MMVLFDCWIVAERASSSREADPSGAIFQRGVVYRGLYFPSLSNSFRQPPLEAAYQRYSHRQRQKSLIVVNCKHARLRPPVSICRLIECWESSWWPLIALSRWNYNYCVYCSRFPTPLPLPPGWKCRASCVSRRAMFRSWDNAPVI